MTETQGFASMPGGSSSAPPPTPYPQQYEGQRYPTQQETQQEVSDQLQDNNARGDGYISRAELNEILAERDKKHAEELASVRVAMPQAMVAAHAAGPGSDNHQVSWSKAEQEASQRGEVLDTWEVRA